MPSDEVSVRTERLVMLVGLALWAVLMALAIVTGDGLFRARQNLALTARWQPTMNVLLCPKKEAFV